VEKTPTLAELIGALRGDVDSLREENTALRQENRHVTSEGSTSEQKDLSPMKPRHRAFSVSSGGDFCPGFHHLAPVSFRGFRPFDYAVVSAFRKLFNEIAFGEVLEQRHTQVL